MLHKRSNYYLIWHSLVLVNFCGLEITFSVVTAFTTPNITRILNQVPIGISCNWYKELHIFLFLPSFFFFDRFSYPVVTPFTWYKKELQTLFLNFIAFFKSLLPMYKTTTEKNHVFFFFFFEVKKITSSNNLTLF